MRQTLPRPACAEFTLAAGQHRGHEQRLPHLVFAPVAGVDDRADDLVAECERQLGVGPDPFVEEADIGMADPAGGDFEQHFAGAGGGQGLFGQDKRLALLEHAPGDETVRHARNTAPSVPNERSL